MSEIEVKVLNIKIEDIKSKMAKIGAVQVKKENQINSMYDYEDQRLFKQKGFARIRETYDYLKDETKYILGIKKMISQEKYKEMLEEETEVSDLVAANNILHELGLEKVRVDKKFRESYKLGEILYEIDTWDKETYPKPYLEVEAPDEETLVKGLELIGYTLADSTAKSLYELNAALEEN
jgi:adenylate cyclase class 2